MKFLKGIFLGPDGLSSSKRIGALGLILTAIAVSIIGVFKDKNLVSSILSLDLTGAFGLLGITVADRFIQVKKGKEGEK